MKSREESGEVPEIVRLVDVQFASGQRDGNQRAGRIHQQGACPLVAAKREELRKCGAGKHGRNTEDAGVGGGHNRGRRLRTERVHQRAQVLCSQMRLIAAEDEGAGCSRIQRVQAGVNGTRDSLLPFTVDQDAGRRGLEGRTNRFSMRAEDSEDRRCAGFAGEANCPGEQRFAVQQEQLLGLAEAAAGAGGENDGGNGHPDQCNGKRMKTIPHDPLPDPDEDRIG